MDETVFQCTTYVDLTVSTCKYVCMSACRGVGEWVDEWCGRHKQQSKRDSEIYKYKISTFCARPTLNYTAKERKIQEM